ncbi:hypothetical protein P4576_05990 [Peribacillus frigoritolerans]|uniref:hypothetical protein n=1 Tax=Peribacillus frigoritolerans TaxID=450367 RepID=UPI002E1A2AB7|nr:hypothetical protein [Peribacillus frigoritolerans]
MELKNQFVFRGVGQGLFYTGKVGEFIFVYDCGSMSVKDLSYLNDSIEEFKEEVNSDTLGLLVISHFDNDHVNGIPNLSKKFKKINTVVMPYIDPLSRLLVLLNNPRQSTEYYQFLVDPITYLTSHFSIKELIIMGEENEEGIRSNDLDNVYPNDWVVPSGKLVKHFGSEDENFKGRLIETENLVISDMGSNIYSHGNTGFLRLDTMWKFSFFNYDLNDESISLFKQKLAEKGIYCSSKNDLKSIVRDNSIMNNVKKCYNQFIKEVNTKFGKNIKDLNNTSLVLLHGPMNEENSDICYFHEPKRKLTKVINSRGFKKIIDDSNSVRTKKRRILNLKKRIDTIKITINYGKTRSFGIVNRERFLSYKYNFNKTILFGDLNVTKDLDQIQKHFGLELASVTTVLIPHHASKGYFNQEFIKLFSNWRRSVWVANYGVTNTYGHPNPELLEQLKDFEPMIKVALNNELMQIRQHIDVTWKM